MRKTRILSCISIGVVAVAVVLAFFSYRRITSPTRRFGEIEEFIAFMLPQLHSVDSTKTWSLKAVPTEAGGALSITGKVGSKNDFAVMHLVLHNFWALHSDKPIEMKWEVYEEGVGVIPADQMSVDWLK